MNNSFPHCSVLNAVTSHPLLQQHSLIRYSGLQGPILYQWDHAVTLSVERREEKKRKGRDIVCHNL